MTDAIAEVTALTGYDGLNGAFRIRAEQLKITRDDIDVLGGLTRGHGSKLLAPYPIKAIGRTTLGPLLHALKLKLLVVADDGIVWSVQPRGRRTKHRAILNGDGHGIGNMQETRALTAKLVRELLRKHARRAGLRSAAGRMLKISPAKRRRIARHASRTRWKRVRAARASA